jgi:N4-gp56 family major capsid protein
MAINTYNDISPRVEGRAVADFIKRALPLLTIEKFAQTRTMPTRDTQTLKWRRYNPLPLATTPLVEGVTPPGRKATVTDVEARLLQYGDFVPLTDVIMDTHEDPVFSEMRQVLAEQAAQTVEKIRFGYLKAGTNVFFANGNARTDVNTALTLNLQRKVIRSFRRQNASPFTSVLSSSVNYGTQAVEASFVGLVHPDCEYVIRGLAGFKHIKDYGQGPVWEGEIGTVESVRYVMSTVFESFPDAGGAKGTTISTSGTSSDVYPVIYMAKDAFATVALRGQNAMNLIVKNPGSGGTSDPLNQRGTIGWKTMMTAVILQQLFMARAEIAVPEIA